VNFVSSSERREVSRRGHSQSYETLMLAQQGVLEQKLPRGKIYPFKERKGQRPLRSEQLKLREKQSC
jgi:hypothetical protein